MMYPHSQHKGRTRHGGRKERRHEKKVLEHSYFSLSSRPVLERMWAVYSVMRRDCNLLVRVSYTDRKKARMELEEI